MADHINRDDLATYLEIVHGGKPWSDWFMTWHLNDKVSRWWHTTIDCLDHYAKMETPTNIYCGLGWSASDRGSRQRVTIDTVSGWPGFGVDIDILGIGHKEKNYPPDRDTGLAIIKSAHVQPSLIVWSGHGYQAYWILKEPILIDTLEARKEVQIQSAQWGNYILSLCAARGYTCDSVHDLARVLRLPGTMNVKDGDEPRPAFILGREDKVYDQGDKYTLDDLFAPLAKVPRATNHVSTSEYRSSEGDYDVDMTGGKGLILVESMREIDPTFMKWWDKKARVQKPSQSEWDEGLAVYICGNTRWIDQQIANVLVAYRLKWKAPDKREELFRRDVARAREWIAKNTAKDSAKILAEELQGIKIASDNTDRRIEVQSAIKDMLGENLTLDMIHYVNDGRDYYILVVNGKEAGHAISTKDLISGQGIKEAVQDTISHALPPRKTGEWAIIVNLLNAIVIERTVRSPYEVGKRILEKYYRGRSTVKTMEEAVITHGSFYFDEDALVYWTDSLDFDVWAERELSEQHYKIIHRYLEACHVITRVKTAVIEHSYASRRTTMLCIPRSVLDDERFQDVKDGEGNLEEI